MVYCNRPTVWCTFRCQISSPSVYSVVLWRRKTPIVVAFWTSVFSVSPIGSSLRKLNRGAQLQTYPYPTESKSFLYSNPFTVKSGAQSVTFKSVTDRQTNKKQRFWPPRRRVKSEPHQTWHGDRGPRARSCTSKTFGGLTHSFAARGR